MSVAHAVAHRAESHATPHDGEHQQLARGEVHGSSAELENVDRDLGHEALHAVVNVGPVTTLPLFVGIAAVVLPAWALVVVPESPGAFSVLARPPGLSTPTPATRAPPIG